MKFLTFQEIKAQLRLDDAQAEEEQTLLEMYGESAEDAILDLCQRSYTDVVETYGEVPVKLKHAALLLVDHFYQHRGVASPQSLASVPYSFDMLVKPFMRLTTDNVNNNNNYGYGKHCNL